MSTLGSDTFLTDSWHRFSDWLADSDFSYLLIAGDLVDGIGIYPGHENELTIKNIYEQYEAFGAMMQRSSLADEDCHIAGQPRRGSWCRATTGVTGCIH